LHSFVGERPGIEHARLHRLPRSDPLEQAMAMLAGGIERSGPVGPLPPRRSADVCTFPIGLLVALDDAGLRARPAEALVGLLIPSSA
jgi:hypothetical protein